MKRSNEFRIDNETDTYEKGQFEKKKQHFPKHATVPKTKII